MSNLLEAWEIRRHGKRQTVVAKGSDAPVPTAKARPKPAAASLRSRPVVRKVSAAPTPPAAEPVEGSKLKALRQAAREVIKAYASGDLTEAVRGLETTLGEKGVSIDGHLLRNLYHPASYRKEYPVTLTGEELMRLQLLTNAASMAGPIGLTTYVIKPEAMAWARELLRKIREG